jgi:hypothetical protein
MLAKICGAEWVAAVVAVVIIAVVVEVGSR